MTPTVSTDWSSGDGGDSGTVTQVSSAEARGTSWPSGDVLTSSDQTSIDTSTSSAESCWHYSASAKRGISVYYRAVWQHTYWCAKNTTPHTITYRRTRTSFSTGDWCGMTYVSHYKLDGGVGYDYLDVHSEAGFDCSTVWPFSLHSVCKLNVHYDWSYAYWTHRECSA